MFKLTDSVCKILYLYHRGIGGFDTFFPHSLEEKVLSRVTVENIYEFRGLN